MWVLKVMGRVVAISKSLWTHLATGNLATGSRSLSPMHLITTVCQHQSTLRQASLAQKVFTQLFNRGVTHIGPSEILCTVVGVMTILILAIPFFAFVYIYVMRRNVLPGHQVGPTVKRYSVISTNARPVTPMQKYLRTPNSQLKHQPQYYRRCMSSPSAMLRMSSIHGHWAADLQGHYQLNKKVRSCALKAHGEWRTAEGREHFQSAYGMFYTAFKGPTAPDEVKILFMRRP